MKKFLNLDLDKPESHFLVKSQKMSFKKWFYENKWGLFTGTGLFATLYGGMVYTQEHFQRKKYRSIIDLIPPEDPIEAKRQKVFLVTGANSGMYVCTLYTDIGPEN